LTWMDSPMNNSSDYGNKTKGRKGVMRGGKWMGRKETMLKTLQDDGPLTLREIYAKMRPAPQASLRRAAYELQNMGLIQRYGDKWQAI